jgi:hypothetical protein
MKFVFPFLLQLLFGFMWSSLLLSVGLLIWAIIIKRRVGPSPPPPL